MDRAEADALEIGRRIRSSFMDGRVEEWIAAALRERDEEAARWKESAGRWQEGSLANVDSAEKMAAEADRLRAERDACVAWVRRHVFGYTFEPAPCDTGRKAAELMLAAIQAAAQKERP